MGCCDSQILYKTEDTEKQENVLFETVINLICIVEKPSDQQVLQKDGQMDGWMDRQLEDEEQDIQWEGVWKQFLPHLSVINMEKEQCGSANPPTSRMLFCFLGRVKKPRAKTDTEHR